MKPVNEKLSGLIGMARRAGRLILGTDAVKESLASGKAQLVLLAADLSAKSEKELRFAAGNTPLAATGITKEEMGRITGRQTPVGVAATEDKGFAAAMIKAAHSGNEEDDIWLPQQ